MTNHFYFLMFTNIVLQAKVKPLSEIDTIPAIAYRKLDNGELVRLEKKDGDYSLRKLVPVPNADVVYC